MESCLLFNETISYRNRNRNLKTSKALLKSQAHQGTNLFTSAATNQSGIFPEGGQEKLRSDCPISTMISVLLYTGLGLALSGCTTCLSLAGEVLEPEIMLLWLL